jgi:polysaccharide export outer membrane protein
MQSVPLLPPNAPRFWRFFFCLCLGPLLLAGCADTRPPGVAGQVPAQTGGPLRLREGDTIKVGFPGAPNLSASHKIQRDGKVNLPLVGEVRVSGKTPGEIEEELQLLYKDQLVSGQVRVNIEAAAFSVFVTGAVMHPGEVMSDRPLSCLEAIMKAGGFDQSRADLKRVTVIRNLNGKMAHYPLDLKRVLEGGDESNFYLQPSDIVYIRERFNWF